MPTLTVATTKPAATTADALLVPITPGRGKKVSAHGAGLTAAQGAKIAQTLQAVGATGKAGEVTVIPAPTGVKASVVVGVGLGDRSKDGTGEQMRRAYGNAIRALAGKRKVAVVTPDDEPETVAAVAMATRLAAYSFGEFKSEPAKPVETIAIVTTASELRDVVDRAEI
ncbi:MAG: leucyl aminopeptidase, partial [Actinomycetota bacterium]|nr:leucyl aminopeptidase [Actinomycetota bacterium]